MCGARLFFPIFFAVTVNGELRAHNALLGLGSPSTVLETFALLLLCLLRAVERGVGWLLFLVHAELVCTIKPAAGVDGTAGLERVRVGAGGFKVFHADLCFRIKPAPDLVARRLLGRHVAGNFGFIDASRISLVPEAGLGLLALGLLVHCSAIDNLLGAGGRWLVVVVLVRFSGGGRCNYGERNSESQALSNPAMNMCNDGGSGTGRGY